MTFSDEKDYIQPPASIGSADEPIGRVLPLLPLVAVDGVIVEEALFTFPISNTMLFDLYQVVAVPLKLNRFKLA
jgi:hypothetical protein